MTKELIAKLHPANISMENKIEIENLSIEELQTLADTYRNQIRGNLFEVRDLSNGQTFFAHYSSLIYHKKNRTGFEFEVTDVYPSSSTPGTPVIAKKEIEKVEPAKPLEKVESKVVEPVSPLETKEDAKELVSKSGSEVTTGDDIKELRKQYKVKFGKAVPVKQVNDIEFIKSKLAE